MEITITILSVVITAVATLFAFLAYMEWRYLKKFKEELHKDIQNIKDDITKNLSASHKIIASYSVKDIDTRIELLEDALSISPAAYNGYNTLGYAYIEKKQYDNAIESFTKACMYHPDDPAGYCDLAFAYMLNNNLGSCKYNLHKAISLDKNQEELIKNDTRFTNILL